MLEGVVSPNSSGGRRRIISNNRTAVFNVTYAPCVHGREVQGQPHNYKVPSSILGSGCQLGTIH